MPDGPGTSREVEPWDNTTDLHPLIEGLEPPYSEPTPEDPPPPDQFGVTSKPPSSPPSSAGLVLLALGLAFLVGGVFLFAAGSFVSHSAQSFDQQCSHIPGCNPGPDPSALLFGGGLGLIALGVFLFVIGYRRSTSRKAWDPTSA